MTYSPNEKIKNNIVGSEWWLNSEKYTWPEIVVGSRVMDAWARFNLIEPEYKNAILKPLNRYVSNLYPRPELVKIEENLAILRQRTHAEIWVDEKADGLYALDKTNQRQFYPSEHNHNFSECYPASYRFYVPWFIDRNIEAEIKEITDEDTAFKIIPGGIRFYQQNINSDYIDTNFINFGIKKSGSWMLDGRRGIIPRLSAMYDIVIYLNETDMDLLRRQYGQ